jgi:hypothetical protein
LVKTVSEVPLTVTLVVFTVTAAPTGCDVEEGLFFEVVGE